MQNAGVNDDKPVPAKSGVGSHSSRGFTSISLRDTFLLPAAVISLLAGVAIPSLNNMRASSRLKTLQMDMPAQLKDVDLQKASVEEVANSMGVSVADDNAQLFTITINYQGKQSQLPVTVGDFKNFKAIDPNAINMDEVLSKFQYFLEDGKPIPPATSISAAIKRRRDNVGEKAR